MMQNTITMRVALSGTVTGSIAKYEFGAHVQSEPSIDGIQEGRISRLTVNSGQDVLLNYDRGWQTPVPESCRGIFDKLVKALEELPS
jgi:hypothetical protein